MNLPLKSFRFGLFITALYFSFALMVEARLAILSFVSFPMVTVFVSSIGFKILMAVDRFEGCSLMLSMEIDDLMDGN